MGKLLFLAHRLPYPPNKGEKIRAWHLLRHLASIHEVRLASLADEPVAPEHLAVLRELCAECRVETVGTTPLQWRNLQALVTGQPISCSHFLDEGLARWVESLCAEWRPEVFFACSGAMAQYLPRPPPQGLLRIIDFVDVDSEKWRHYAARAPGPVRFLYAREARVLRAYEERTAHLFDASLFVSESEAAGFRAAHPDCRETAVVIENGVDADAFSPALREPCPDGIVDKTMVFVGNMDYRPNSDAACWFATEILPLVRARYPEAGFAIVGANPRREVRDLASLKGVRVTGAVDRVQPYLAHAALAVAPMRLSPGIPNKVLEAMAMEKPVVATPAAVRGLVHAAPDRNLLVGEDAAAFARQVVRLLDDPARGKRLGQEARRCVLAHYTWDMSFEKLDRLLSGGPGGLAGG